MRNQHRTSTPYSLDSLRRGLDHHQQRGTVRSFVSRSSSEKGAAWLIDVGGELREFTSPQTYALCVGLASSGMHYEQEGRTAIDAVLEAMCDSGGRFTCEEANWIAKLFRLLGHEHAAVAFLEAHGDSDGDEDEHAWTSCGACGERVPGSHVCDLGPRGRHVVEATEVFDHPAIASATRDLAHYEQEAAAYYNAATSGEGIAGRVAPFPSFEEWATRQGWPGEMVGS